MKFQKVLMIGLLMASLFSLTGCTINMLEAGDVLKGNEEDELPEISFSILLDNSGSFDEYMKPSLDQIDGVVKALKAQAFREAEVSFGIIGNQSIPIYSGNVKSKDFQSGSLSELYNATGTKRSKYTNISKSVSDAIYKLNAIESKRRVLIIFSDMQATSPQYALEKLNEGAVPPPDFPWEEVAKCKGIEVFCVYPSLATWRNWESAYNDLKLEFRFEAVFPEDIKSKGVADRILKEKLAKEISETEN